MIWQPLEVVTPPEGEISLADARDYCRFRQDETADDDAALNSIRAAVPLSFERTLNRAVFAQRRAFSVVLGQGEGFGGASLEPHTALAVTMQDGSALPFRSFGQIVMLSQGIVASETTLVRFEYDAGWRPADLPADMKEALLYEIMVRYVRRNEAINQSETIRLPRSRPMPAHYQIYPDPARTQIAVENLAAD